MEMWRCAMFESPNQVEQCWSPITMQFRTCSATGSVSAFGPATGGGLMSFRRSVPPWRRAHTFLPRVAVVVLFCLTCSAGLWAATLSGKVKDPSGAVIAGAQIEISGGSLPESVVLSSDALGEFSSPDLAPGKYKVGVTRDGFEPLQ